MLSIFKSISPQRPLQMVADLASIVVLRWGAVPSVFSMLLAAELWSEDHVNSEKWKIAICMFINEQLQCYATRKLRSFILVCGVNLALVGSFTTHFIPLYNDACLAANVYNINLPQSKVSWLLKLNILHVLFKTLLIKLKPLILRSSDEQRLRPHEKKSIKVAKAVTWQDHKRPSKERKNELRKKKSFIKLELFFFMFCSLFLTLRLVRRQNR